MINKKEFKKLIHEFQEFDLKVNKIEDVTGFSLVDSLLYSYPTKLFDQVLTHEFKEEAVDIIYWWMYEHDKSEEEMWDEDGKTIPMRTLNDLWNYVKTLKK